MIIFWYLGIICLCYGTYHLVCYLQMFPTKKGSALVMRIGNNTGLLWVDVIAFTVAENLKNKYELEWKNADQVNPILRGKGFYINGTTYLIGKIITYLVGIMILLPLCFIKIKVFGTLLVFWTLIRIWDVFKVFKKDVRKEKKEKYIVYTCKLLTGAFFIAQILVFICLLT